MPRRSRTRRGSTSAANPFRSHEASEYSLRWIDKLQEMAEAWPGWRSQKEKDHVYAQFEQARQIYRKFAGEAPATDDDEP